MGDPASIVRDIAHGVRHGVRDIKKGHVGSGTKKLAQGTVGGILGGINKMTTAASTALSGLQVDGGP